MIMMICWDENVMCWCGQVIFTGMLVVLPDTGFFGKAGGC
jgi:hypothetical protein